MRTSDAIGSDNITTIGVGVIVVLIILGLVAGLLVTKIIARVLILAVVIVLGVVVWQQRTHVENAINARACKLDTTFFGVHLDVPDSVRQACRGRS